MEPFQTETSLLRGKISDIITSELPSFPKLSGTLFRPHRDLTKGDFIIPQACFNSTYCGPVPLKDTAKSLSMKSNEWNLEINSSSYNEESGVIIKLNRRSTFAKVVKDIISKGKRYGNCYFTGEQAPWQIIINVVPLKDGVKRDILGYLRTVLIGQLLKEVILAVGGRAELINQFSFNVPSKLTPLFSNILSTAASFQSSASIDVPNSIKAEFMNQIKLSEYLVKECEFSDKSSECNSQKDGKSAVFSPSCDGKEDRIRLSECWLNLRRLCSQRGLPVGSKGYSPNIDKVKALESDGEFSTEARECCIIESEICKFGSQRKPSDKTPLLHISTNAVSFTQQKIDLMWRCLSQNTEHFKQLHLVVGPVHVPKGEHCTENTDLEVLYYCIEEKMREASRLRNGEDVQDSEIEVFKRQILTCAAITFDILRTTPATKLKLDTSRSEGEGGCPDSGPGVFVLYNCARLATLLQRFDDEVKKGTYPPLPDVDSIDFGLLHEDQEWKLLFLHLLQYPDILLSTIENLFSANGPACNINSSKVCRFLMSLSQDLSIYYSKIHVLVDPIPHLLPTMYARLYLLKSVMQVMRNGLALLGIEPLMQM